MRLQPSHLQSTGLAVGSSSRVGEPGMEVKESEEMSEKAESSSAVAAAADDEAGGSASVGSSTVVIVVCIKLSSLGGG